MPGVPNKNKWEGVLASEPHKNGKSAQKLNEETIAEFKKIVGNEELDPRPAFWHLVYYLKVEKELKLGLTTNTDKQTAQFILDHLGIKETFDYMLFGDDISKPKPNPEIYLKALKMANVSNKEALVFEDSPAGAEAANKANLDLIVIWNTDIPKSYFPEKTLLFVPSFEGLANNMDHTIDEAYAEFQKSVLGKENTETVTQHPQTQIQPR